MAEEDKNHHHMYQGSWTTFQYQDHMKNKNDHDDKTCTSTTSTSSIGEESTVSNGSSSMCCSSDTADDASSSSSSIGYLYDLSEIMAQLPIKRGLSKFYVGKSESFTSLSRVTSVEDLVKKKATPYSRRKKLKASKSCGNGMSNNISYRSYTLPKAVISKKPTRGCSSLHHIPK